MQAVQRAHDGDVEQGIDEHRPRTHRQESQQGHPATGAGHGVAGRGEEVEEGGGVEAEAPVFIQHQVDDKDDAYQQGDEDEIGLEHHAQPSSAAPGRSYQQQAGKGAEIARHAEVERKAVQDDIEARCPGFAGIQVGIEQHKQGFLHCEEADKKHVDFDERQQSFFHLVLISEGYRLQK